MNQIFYLWFDELRFALDTSFAGDWVLGISHLVTPPHPHPPPPTRPGPLAVTPLAEENGSVWVEADEEIGHRDDVAVLILRLGEEDVGQPDGVHAAVV